MKHIRTFVEFIFVLSIILAFAFGIGTIETDPLAGVILVGVAVTLIYVLIIIRTAVNRPKPLDPNAPAMWIEINGEYVAMDGSMRKRPLNDKPQNSPVFNHEGKEV